MVSCDIHIVSLFLFFLFFPFFISYLQLNMRWQLCNNTTICVVIFECFLLIQKSQGMKSSPFTISLSTYTQTCTNGLIWLIFVRKRNTRFTYNRFMLHFFFHGVNCHWEFSVPFFKSIYPFQIKRDQLWVLMIFPGQYYI